MRRALLVCVLALGCQGVSTPTQPGPTDTASPTPSPASSPVVSPTPSAQKLHVAGFGDSVTNGFCSTTGHDYVSLLIDNDDALYPEWEGKDLTSKFASVELTNAAINGTTSCSYSGNGIRTYIQDYLAANPFDADRTILVVTLGGNDLIEPYGCSASADCAAFCSSLAEATPWSENYKTRMIEFITIFEEEIPGDVDIFLATIYDPTDGVGDIENATGVNLPPWPDGLAIHSMYNDRVTEIAAATGATIVDMRAAMLGHGIHHDDPGNPYYDATDPTYWYCSNLEDPNDLGYNAIRGAFWGQIETVLGL